MSPRTVTLGGEVFQVTPRPLGVMRQLVPAFQRCAGAFAAAVMDEAALGDAITVVALGLGKDAAEVERIPATFEELLAALDAVAGVCGLKPRGESPPGEALGAQSSAGTSSTPG